MTFANKELEMACAKDPCENQKPRRKQADVLIALTVGKVALFHHRDRAYADVYVEGHRETWPVRGSRFRQWLKRL